MAAYLPSHSLSAYRFINLFGRRGIARIKFSRFPAVGLRTSPLIYSFRDVPIGEGNNARLLKRKLGKFVGHARSIFFSFCVDRSRRFALDLENEGGENISD
jgi:hypothetical protein